MKKRNALNFNERTVLLSRIKKDREFIEATKVNMATYAAELNRVPLFWDKQVSKFHIKTLVNQGRIPASLFGRNYAGFNWRTNEPTADSLTITVLIPRKWPLGGEDKKAESPATVSESPVPAMPAKLPEPVAVTEPAAAWGWGQSNVSFVSAPLPQKESQYEKFMMVPAAGEETEILRLRKDMLQLQNEVSRLYAVMQKIRAVLSVL